MKTKRNSRESARSLFHARTYIFVLGALAFTAGLLASAPALAQTAGAGATKNISLNFQNAPIQTVLHTLFTSEGVNNSIDQDVQGNVSISVNDVPFDVALRTLLRSANPPLTYDMDNGIYHIKVQRYTAPATTVTPTTTPGTTAGGSDTTSGDTTAQGRYYRIAINHYDAFYMAEMLYQAGVKKAAPVRVPSDPLSGSSGQNGQSGGYGGQSGGFGGGGFGQSGFGGQSGGFGGQSGFGGGGYGGQSGGFGGGIRTF